MKMWVCREVFFNAQYVLFTEDCTPQLVNGDHWECHCSGCEGEHDILEAGLCPNGTKLYGGLRRHLPQGTKRLMTWTPPLADNK